MSVKVSDTTAKGQIQFIQNHQTPLDAGEYKIEIEQTIKIDDIKETFSSDLTFAVRGNRFALNPQEIHAVFPPSGSLGDHSHILPHIALKSSTLPWERLAQSGNQNAPWLGLLIIYEEETQGETPSVLPLTVLQLEDLNERVEAVDQPRFPGIGIEDLEKFQVLTGHNITDRVTVLDLKRGLLEAILPTINDLEYLAHVRQVTTGDTENSESLSLVISNRLPKKEGISTAYLVSLEERYNDNGEFNYQNATNENYIRLVVLKNWSFSCTEPEQSFMGLLENFNLLFSIDLSDTDEQTLNQGEISDSLKTEFKKNNNPLSENYSVVPNSEGWDITDENKHYSIVSKNNRLSVYDRDGILRLPKNINADTKQYLTKGYIPLPHYLRQGGKTFSWYHSPLIPGQNQTDLKLSQLSVRSADQLISYNSNTGLFDISYAAAWQLGQLLALQDKQFATSLFNWKRNKAQKIAQNNQQALFPHIFPDNSGSDSINNDLPEDLKTWFEQLGLLYDVPFNYLVPEEQMLPPESIRFFWLDWFWVESLLDGAFSIGRVQVSSAQQDSTNNPLTGEAKKITGFIMRSEVVSGWSDLQIDGSESSITGDLPMLENQKAKILRCDRLSENVLICLFDGEILTVDISLKPEGLHFGFNNDENGNLERELRKLDGTERSDWKVQPIHWKDETRKVVNINNLVDEIKNELTNKNEIEKTTCFTSAQFALQMIQGAEKVRFISGSIPLLQ
ncbi:MAG: hypothetical protein QNJ72_05480 [Pleurocapsa sp. MO_226.B13]|nr:hypothetical protein [Pleurocapsa sp. MO_226.B13]